MTYIHTCSHYLEPQMSDPRRFIEGAKWDLQFVEFDTIVCRGLSGLLIAPTVATEMGKHLLIVRKDKFNTHGHSTAEGHLGHQWVFFDDFISTHSTEHACRDAVEEVVRRYRGGFYAGFDSIFIGSYEYSYRRYVPSQSLREYENSRVFQGKTHGLNLPMKVSKLK